MEIVVTNAEWEDGGGRAVRRLGADDYVFPFSVSLLIGFCVKLEKATCWYVVGDGEDYERRFAIWK